MSEERVVIVTGSSSGIGKAIAESFATRGCRVVVNSRQMERAKAVADELSERGLSVHPIQADVTDAEQVKAMVDEAVSKFGRLDVMVNNAGQAKHQPAVNYAPQVWRDHIDVFMNAAFYGAQAAAKQMIAQGGGGVVINITSVFGHGAAKTRAAYISAKHGLEGMTMALATEWGEHNIRVISLAPGFIETQYTPVDFKLTDVPKRVPLGRFGKTSEMGEIAFFLASEAASFITGVSIVADGGWLASCGWPPPRYDEGS